MQEEQTSHQIPEGRKAEFHHDKEMNMTISKPWYLSRTIWASVITVAMAACGLVGVPVDAGQGTALTDSLLEAVTAISGVVAILGRLAATARIGQG